MSYACYKHVHVIMLQRQLNSNWCAVHNVTLAQHKLLPALAHPWTSDNHSHLYFNQPFPQRVGTMHLIVIGHRCMYDCLVQNMCIHANHHSNTTWDMPTHAVATQLTDAGHETGMLHHTPHTYAHNVLAPQLIHDASYQLASARRWLSYVQWMALASMLQPGPGCSLLCQCRAFPTVALACLATSRIPSTTLTS